MTKLPQLQQNFAFSVWGRADDTHTTVRFCTSWATKEDNVKALIASL
jgi:threonine aldolase